jgi:hypothetical protein
MNPIQKRSSQWEYHRNAARKRSDSLSAINSPTNNQLKYDRYSICEFNHKKSSFITNKQRKSTNFTHQKPRYKSKDFYHQRNSERYSSNLKKYSLSSNASTNSVYNRGQPLHYITCKHENNQRKFLGLQLSSTTASNLTHSTMNASSDSSFFY